MAKNQDGVLKQAKKYCCEPIEYIEGYSDMIASDEKWCCHHKRGIDEEKSKQQLINEGLYFDRPASELVIMTIYDHKSLHGKNKRTETKKKNSDAMSGENHFMWGKHHSIESRRKMSESHKGLQAGEKHYLYGKHLSEETRQKISEANKCEKNPKARTVVQLTMDGQFVREWSYISEAEQYGFNYSKISNCCNGKRPHHKGYKWQYADDYYQQQQNHPHLSIQLEIDFDTTGKKTVSVEVS